MTSLQITYFLKVAECMSFSKAAEELYVSQPSVSRQVRQLEEELGFQLFDRTLKHQISLTAAGMVFRDSFMRFAQGYQQARAAATEMSRQATLRLRVGITQNWDVTEALMRFQEQVELRYPQAEVYYENNSSLQLRRRLEADQLDVVYCIRTTVQNFDHLEVLDVAEMETRAYVRKGLLTPAEQPLRMSDFHGQTLLMLPEEEAPMSQQIVQLQFQTHQVTVNPVRLPNRESVFQAVLMGRGFTVGDQQLWDYRDPRITYFKMQEPIPVCLVWDKRNQNPLIRLFAETMLQELGDGRRLD